MLILRFDRLSFILVSDIIIYSLIVLDYILVSDIIMYSLIVLMALVEVELFFTSGG